MFVLLACHAGCVSFWLVMQAVCPSGWSCRLCVLLAGHAGCVSFRLVMQAACPSDLPCGIWVLLACHLAVCPSACHAACISFWFVMQGASLLARHEAGGPSALSMRMSVLLIGLAGCVSFWLAMQAVSTLCLSCRLQALLAGHADCEYF
jgi:hypothetical protein